MNELESLYITYHKFIFKYLYGLCGNYLMAEELTQETFYNVVKSFYTFRGDSNVSTWMHGIARNVFYKWNAKRIPGHIELDDVEEFDQPHDSTFSPEREYDKKEESLKIRNTLKLLSESYRELLILRDWQELSYEEIAKITNHTLSWVKVNIYRARAEFKSVYNSGEVK